MNNQTTIPTLESLAYLPYLDSEGNISEDIQKQIGVYGIFNQDKILQFVGYSRDIYLSLKQHLVRQPQNCYWLKIQTIQRPSRSVLEAIRQAWIAENGVTPPGNVQQETLWTKSIDAKPAMTESEKAQYNQSDELGKTKILKQVSRRLEAEIKEQLRDRGVNMDIRFNPKLKEQGLLDLK
ncbi:MAG: GIY-YIG nuclease family protein [Xenococcaceae cyanobacterium MO_207.B15]|nr:GIY-YIG nuclease family protein [Xenococcaceae cyanobacterium MO_207.B15]